MFERLSVKIDKAVQILKGKNTITELNVSGVLKEIRTALVEADVHYKIAKTFTQEIKEEAIGQNVITSISPGQLLLKITHDKLVQLLGGQSLEMTIKGNPSVILIAGLQGSGKTTLSGKLAHYFKHRGHQVMLAACDIYRPAAIEQLNVLGEQIEVEVYSETGHQDPVKIAQSAMKHASKSNTKILIVDTAGRLGVDEKMMHEIRQIKSVLSPAETCFVADAMTGQDAVNTAKAFNDALNFDSVVLSKMDGDARGGAALSIYKTTGKPIKFISTGEKMSDLERFHPDRMAGRILGKGDMVALVEKAQQVFNEEEARRISKKLKKNQFDLSDFLLQLQQIQKMGGIKELANKMPMKSHELEKKPFDEDMIKHNKAIIQSMTEKERQYPDQLNSSRKNRIAKGSGSSIQQVNQLLKQFEGMRKMAKRMNKAGGAKELLNSLKTSR